MGFSASSRSGAYSEVPVHPALSVELEPAAACAVEQLSERALRLRFTAAARTVTACARKLTSSSHYLVFS